MDGSCSVSGGDELLRILQARGSLFSSCEHEVRELMHQLDILISTRCGKWEKENVRITSLLKKKEERVEYLQRTLAERDSEIAQLKSNREREYLAHSADCEAQLVRLRSEVTRISHSYEQLKAKRHHQRESKLNTKEHELSLELDRLKLSLHLSSEELKTAEGRIAQLEDEKGDQKGITHRIQPDGTNSTRERFETTEDDERMDQYVVLEPVVLTQETSHLLQDMFDKHYHKLNHDIQKIFAN